MANTLDYLTWRGDLSFEAAPFNELDLYVCSQLSTPEYEGILGSGEEKLLSDCVKEYFTIYKNRKTLGVLQSEFILSMFRLMFETERYMDIMMADAVEIVDLSKGEQFAAVTILLPDGTFCVSFRGTDDTIIGWKEDFELAIKESVPAQDDAVIYLRKAAERFPGGIRICGHSKGGNLAIWAASNVDSSIQDRIIEVVSFDGPGFRDEFFTTSNYENVKDKITTVISNHSTVGLLLNLAGKQEIVKADATGAVAHDGFHWEVIRNRFSREPQLSESSKKFKLAMDKTLEDMSYEERQEFTNELFNSLLSTGAITLTDLKEAKLPETIEILKNLRDDKKVHDFMKTVLEYLVKLK